MAAPTITIELPEDELRAVLAVLEPYISRHGHRDPAAARAETTLDLALLAYEEREGLARDDD